MPDYTMSDVHTESGRSESHLENEEISNQEALRDGSDNYWMTAVWPVRSRLQRFTYERVSASASLQTFRERFRSRFPVLCLSWFCLHVTDSVVVMELWPSEVHSLDLVLHSKRRLCHGTAPRTTEVNPSHSVQFQPCRD